MVFASRCAFATAVAAVLLRLSAGQIFDLDAVDSVHGGAISVHYVYYAYSGNDDKAAATVEVSAAMVPDVEAHMPAKPSVIAAYKLCYIVLVPAASFNLLVRPEKFCEDIRSPSTNLPNTHAFRVGDDTNNKATFTASGAYYLGVANCGEMQGFKLSGRVTVKHAHGFLPAIDIHMTSLYGLWLAIYILIAAVWGCVLLAKSNSVIQLQFYFLVVSLIAVGECLAWLIFYSTWNTGGAMNQILLVAGTFLSTWKVLVLFRMAFAARFAPSEKASVWDEEKLNLALLVWSVPAFHLGFAHFYRSSMNFEGFSIVLNALPAIIFTAGIIVWVMLRISSEVAMLKEIHYDVHVGLLRKTQAILCIAGVGAFISTMVHVFDPTLGYDPTSWSGHAVATDGFPQAVFATTLCASMCVWAPTQALQDAEYQAQGEQPAPGEAEAIGAAQEDDLEDTGPANAAGAE